MKKFKSKEKGRGCNILAKELKLEGAKERGHLGVAEQITSKREMVYPNTQAERRSLLSGKTSNLQALIDRENWTKKDEESENIPFDYFINKL